MPLFLYTALYYLLTPLLFIRLIVKHRKSRAYKNVRQPLRLSERLGIFKTPNFTLAQAPIWIHTVSVGEFIAATPLIYRLMAQYPDTPLVITCTTTTGSAQIIKTLADDIQQGRVFHCYLPYDLPASIKRFFKRIKPSIALIMETEIWPNLLNICAQKQLPIWLLNARMSARSARGYARFKRLTEQALQQFTGIAAQDVLDAGRLKELGAREDTLHITGSIKFDLKVAEQDIEQGQNLRQQLNWQNKKVLIAASTHQGEDELMLSIYQTLKVSFPELVMIIVPRHPERFESVFQMLKQTDKALTIARRSTLETSVSDDVDILVGDTMGEMMCYFSCADLVFMGGTMVPVGGHNILEPAALGLAIVYGPHIFNFYAINELFLQYQAASQVPDKSELEAVLRELLHNPQMAEEMAQRARQLFRQNAGALDKMMKLIR